MKNTLRYGGRSFYLYILDKIYKTVEFVKLQNRPISYF